MKYKDIVLLNNEELKERLNAEKDMLAKLKFAHAVSPIENPMKIRITRRVVAQLNTELVNRIKTT